MSSIKTTLNLLESLTFETTHQKRNTRKQNFLCSSLLQGRDYHLKETATDWCEDWYYYLPFHYLNEIDIKLTYKSKTTTDPITYKKHTKRWLEWTQGSAFNFVGGVIYRPDSEQMPWGEYLKIMDSCIQITSGKQAAPATSIYDTENDKFLQFPREKGEVKFDILIPNADKTQTIVKSSHTLTQDDFVSFLITGELV